MVDRLAERPLTVSELAAPLKITVAAAVQHVQVLEASGLVRTRKTGRVRTCTLSPAVSRSWRAGSRTAAPCGSAGSTGWARCSTTRASRHDRRAQHGPGGPGVSAPTAPGVRGLGRPAAETSLVRPHRRPGGEWHSDLRVDGTEHFSTAPGSTPDLRYTARFRDVVENERIVATTEVTLDGRCATVSVSTVEFEPTPSGCRIRVVEQTAYLERRDTPQVRRTGIATQLTNLARLLGQPSSAPGQHGPGPLEEEEDPCRSF